MSHTFKLILVLPVIIVYVGRKLPVPYYTGISYPGDGQNYIMVALADWYRNTNTPPIGETFRTFDTGPTVIGCVQTYLPRTSSY